MEHGRRIAVIIMQWSGPVPVEGPHRAGARPTFAVPLSRSGRFLAITPVRVVCKLMVPGARPRPDHRQRGDWLRRDGLRVEGRRTCAHCAGTSKGRCSMAHRSAAPRRWRRWCRSFPLLAGAAATTPGLRTKYPHFAPTSPLRRAHASRELQAVDPCPRRTLSWCWPTQARQALTALRTMEGAEPQPRAYHAAGTLFLLAGARSAVCSPLLPCNRGQP